MKLFNAYLLLLLFFFALSSHATDLNDLESRIDQMLERLNKVENSQTVPPSPPVTPIIKEELPSIDLAPLPPPVTNRSSVKTETSKTFNRLEGRIDKLLKRLEINPNTAPAYQPSPTPQPEQSVIELPIIDLETDPSVYSRTYSLPKNQALRISTPHRSPKIDLISTSVYPSLMTALSRNPVITTWNLGTVLNSELNITGCLKTNHTLVHSLRGNSSILNPWQA